MLQFLGVSYGKDWVIKTKTRLAGRCTDGFKATWAAIDLADAEGKVGRAVQVLTENDGPTPHLIWTLYGPTEKIYIHRLWASSAGVRAVEVIESRSQNGVANK